MGCGNAAGVVALGVVAAATTTWGVVNRQRLVRSHLVTRHLLQAWLGQYAAGRRPGRGVDWARQAHPRMRTPPAVPRGFRNRPRFEPPGTSAGNEPGW